MANSTSFKKGWKGGGRKPIPLDVKEAARAACPRAIERLRELLDSDDERVAVMASNSILDRGYGKPAQPVTGENGEGAVLISVNINPVSVKK